MSTPCLGRHLAALAAIASLVVFTGCKSSHPDEVNRFTNVFQAGQLEEAKNIASQYREKGEEGALIWTLELANVQRLSGDLKGSLSVYEEAEEMLKAIDATPDYSLSREGLSTFSNPYKITYRGRNLDRIFASTYQALACIEAGEVERARVAMRRTMFRIDDAKRIASERSKIEKQEAASIGAEDTEFQTRLYSGNVASARAAVNSRFAGLPSYADAMNPFAAWLHGVYFLHTAESSADLEIARKSLQTAAAIVANNKHISDDLALANTATGRPDPGAGKTIVYIVHESGVAPRWSERIITLPLIYADPKAPIVNIALPEITPSGQRLRPIEATFGGPEKVITSPLANVDSIVHAEFKEEYPVARNRAIAAATMKATVAYAANKAAQDNARKKARENEKKGRGNSDDNAELIAVVTLLATNIYTTESAQADLRNWSSLPRQIELGRCVAPRGAQLRLSGGEIVGTRSCPLPAAKAVLVTVRSIAPGAPVVVRASILQK